MKIFGMELKFNGFDVFHKGNFNPDSKTDKALFDKFNLENNIDQYKKSITVTDNNGYPTETEYRRSDNNTLAIKRNASNPDSSGYYQTVLEKFYNSDGSTVYKTVTYTFTYLPNGLIKTSDGGVIS